MKSDRSPRMTILFTLALLLTLLSFTPTSTTANALQSSNLVKREQPHALRLMKKRRALEERAATSSDAGASDAAAATASAAPSSASQSAQASAASTAPAGPATPEPLISIPAIAVGPAANTQASSSSSSSVPAATAPTSTSSATQSTLSTSQAAVVSSAPIAVTPLSVGTLSLSITTPGTSATGLSDASTGTSTHTVRNTVIIVIVIASCIAGALAIWTVFRKLKLKPSSRFEDRMQPIDWQPTTDRDDDSVEGRHRRAVSNTSHGSFHSGETATGAVQQQQAYGTQEHAEQNVGYAVGGYADLQRGGYDAYPQQQQQMSYANLQRGPSLQREQQYYQGQGQIERGPSFNRGQYDYAAGYQQQEYASQAYDIGPPHPSGF